jgi:hypothetical protein
MFVKVEHVKGVEVVEFIKLELELVVSRHGWKNVNDFISNSDFNQREFILQYFPDTIHDMYRIDGK